MILRNGTRLGRLDHVFKDMINVAEAQLQQHPIDKLDVLVVRTNKYSDRDEERIRHESDIRTGGIIDINLHYVPSIERSRNGKLRFVVSSLETGRRAEQGGVRERQ